MNVLVTNKQKIKLQSLDLDIIKAVNGIFTPNELIEMFKDFVYNKLIIDVTALEDYDMPITYRSLINGINPDKIIFFLPEGSSLCTSGFLSRIINIGIYNFTSNIEGVKYLINKSNTLDDVIDLVEQAKEEKFISHETKYINDVENTKKVNSKGPKIIGFQNVTENAGSTSLIYMIKKELSTEYQNQVVALEIDKSDFAYFQDRGMISTTSVDVQEKLEELNDKAIILIDLNDCKIPNLCKETIYIIEPSIIKLNKLMRKNRYILNKLKDEKVILNKSLLSNKDISDFETEANIKVLYNLPPLNERKRNGAIVEFIKKLNLNSDNLLDDINNSIFGLFRK